MIVRNANFRDWEYMEDLRRKESKALGFVPKGTYLSIMQRKPYDGRCRWEYSKVYIVEDDGERTGFCYVSFKGNVAKVHQIVVQEDARRWYRATLMLSEIEKEAIKTGKQGVQARVAIDLEANLFWRASGYEPIKIVNSTWLNQRESKSKTPLVIYQKLFLPLFRGRQPEIEAPLCNFTLKGNKEGRGCYEDLRGNRGLNQIKGRAVRPPG